MACAVYWLGEVVDPPVVFESVVSVEPVTGVGGARAFESDVDALSDDGRGRCEIGVDEIGVEALDEAGGVGGVTIDWIMSLGSGKNRIRPSGSCAAVIFLPYDFGVRI